MKGKLKTILKNGGLFVLLITLTFYIIFKDNDIHDIMRAVSEAEPAYIALGILAMCVFLCCEACNIARALTLFGYRIRPLYGLKYAVTGFFFSSVTPSASGGQPMQVYAMHRDGIEVSHGTLALLFELLSFETVTVLLSAGGFLYQRELIFSLGNVKYLLFLGMGVNLLVAVLLMAAIFSKRAAERFAALLSRGAGIFGRERAERLREQIELQAGEYRRSAGYFKANKRIFAKTLATTAVQMSAMYSIPYLVYRAFGLESFSLPEAAALQAVLYVAVSAMPLPGALGVSESAFMILFRTLFPGSLLGSAMILSRGISFYLFVLLSGIFLAAFTLIKRKEDAYGIHDFDRRRRQGHRQPAQTLSGKQWVQRCHSGKRYPSV